MQFCELGLALGGGTITHYPTAAQLDNTIRHSGNLAVMRNNQDSLTLSCLLLE